MINALKLLVKLVVCFLFHEPTILRSIEECGSRTCAVGGTKTGGKVQARIRPREKKRYRNVLFKGGMQMQSNDEAVFESKQTAPDGKDKQKRVTFDDDDPDFEKPSLLKGITRMFALKKPDGDLDTDFSPVNETLTDFDDAEPKKLILENIANTLKRRPPDDGIDGENVSMSQKSLSAKAEEFDDDFPKPSFLKNLLGGFGKKPDDDDDSDFGNIKIPKK